MAAVDDGTQSLVDVHLVGLPLEAYQHSSEHHEELFREFALILSREPGTGHSVPSRLLALIDEMATSYGGFGAVPQAALDAAVARGATNVDLVYRLPVGAREACARFAELLAEADEYCSMGELLTLAPPPDAVAFRNWFLREFIDQMDGHPPTAYHG